MEFAMTRDGMRAVVSRLCRALPADVALVRVGVEAAGHYHRPLTRVPQFVVTREPGVGA
jgi:hypothetical protein